MYFRLQRVQQCALGALLHYQLLSLAMNLPACCIYTPYIYLSPHMSADVIPTCSNCMLPACRQDETIIEEITDVPLKQAAGSDAVDSQQPLHQWRVCETCGMASPGLTTCGAWNLHVFFAVRV